MDIKEKPNARNEYWVILREDVNGEIWVDGNTTYYSDAWHWKVREEYFRLVDHIIVGKTATMYIIDYGDLGYDKCKSYAFRWLAGGCIVYRLD